MTVVLDFPSTPALNDKYLPGAGQPVYTWDGLKWTTIGGTVGSTGAWDAVPIVASSVGGSGSSTLWSRGDHFHPEQNHFQGDVVMFGSQTVAGTMTIGGHDINLNGALWMHSDNGTVNYYDRNGNRAIVTNSAVISDPTNYYLNTAHQFGAINGATFYVTMSSSGLVITGNGYKPGGGAWADSTSDVRAKNIKRDYTAGLGEVSQLHPVVYTFKGNNTKETPSKSSVPYPESDHYNAAVAQTEFTGLIAQEVEAIFPDMVTKSAGYLDGSAVSDMRGLDTSPLIFALINAVKELKARIEVLEGA